jgi:hypothetical protein
LLGREFRVSVQRGQEVATSLALARLAADLEVAASLLKTGKR